MDFQKNHHNLSNQYLLCPPISFNPSMFYSGSNYSTGLVPPLCAVNAAAAAAGTSAPPGAIDAAAAAGTTGISWTGRQRNVIEAPADPKGTSAPPGAIDAAAASGTTGISWTGRQRNVIEAPADPKGTSARPGAIDAAAAAGTTGISWTGRQRNVIEAPADPNGFWTKEEYSMLLPGSSSSTGLPTLPPPLPPSAIAAAAGNYTPRNAVDAITSGIGTAWSNERDVNMSSAMVTVRDEEEESIDAWINSGRQDPYGVLEPDIVPWPVPSGGTLTMDIPDIVHMETPATLDGAAAVDWNNVGYYLQDAQPLGPVVPRNHPGRSWTVEEHRLFLRGMQKIGKGRWTAISKEVVFTKTPAQVASHAQKFFLRQETKRKKQSRRKSIHDITTY